MPNLRDDLKKIMEAKKAGQPIPSVQKPKLGQGLVEPATMAEAKIPLSKQKTDKAVLGATPSAPVPTSVPSLTSVPIPPPPIDVSNQSSALPKTQESDLTKMERAKAKEGAEADALAGHVVALMDTAGKDSAEPAPEEAPQSTMVAAEKRAGSSLRFTTKDFQLDEPAPSESAPSEQSRIPTEEAVVPQVPDNDYPSELVRLLELEHEDKAEEKAQSKPAPAQKKEIRGTLAFDENGDSGRIGSSCKLFFKRMSGHDRCTLSLIGKDDVQDLELVKGEEQTVSLLTKKGGISITLKFLGANEYGKKEIEYKFEGDAAPLGEMLAQSRKAGESARDLLSALAPYTNEIALGATCIAGAILIPAAIIPIAAAGAFAIWSGVEIYIQRRS